MNLSVDDANLPVAALSLDRLATINDAMAARCGCDARTNVAVAETGFPAYFIRLDPETQNVRGNDPAARRSRDRVGQLELSLWLAQLRRVHRTA